MPSSRVPEEGPALRENGGKMPTGPDGQPRAGDVIGCAIHVAKVATGEVQDETKTTVPARAAGGKKGGRNRAKALTPERRSEIARIAAAARWK